MSLREETIISLKERRQRLLDGSINTIPSPFKRFSKDFLGWEKSTYYIFTSYTKGGKTQLVSHLIFDAILYCYYNEAKTGVSLKVLYFPLEETPQRIMTRFHSWLLMRSKNIRISPSDLRSSDNNKPLSDDVLGILEEEEFVKIVEYFENHVIFATETNPTGIYKFCKQYAVDHGTIQTKPTKYTDYDGTVKEAKSFASYTPDNPNEYVLCVADTINLIQLERNYNKKQSIDKLSEYFITLRNRYGMSPVVIQQQNTDNESVDSVKFNRTRPSTAGLGDSKYTAHDANIVIGIFSPFKFGLDTYLADEHGIGYDIKKLRDHFRTIEVLVNRDGEVGGIIGLFFDGASCTWAEMPKPGQVSEMEKVYNYVKTL